MYFDDYAETNKGKMSVKSFFKKIDVKDFGLQKT